MATVCTTCGQELPRNDARFCSRCGTLVPFQSFSSQAPTANAAARAVQQEAEKPVLREQRVQQPAAEPPLQEPVKQQVQKPARATRRIASDDVARPTVSWPAPLTHVSVRGSLPERVEPRPVPPISTSAPVPELRVKVWEQERLNPPTPLPESHVEEAREPIEDIPTTQLTSVDVKSWEDSPTSIQPENPHNLDVEDRDTVSIPNHPAPPSQPFSTRSMQPRGAGVLQNQRPQAQPMQDVRPAPISTPPTSMTTVRRKKSRVPFIVLLACLCVLIFGAGGWILLANPFAVPAITQPLQSLNDTHLGVSLAYPSGWTVQKSTAGVIFADSSQTAQVKLSTSTATSDVVAYLQQQAAKNGMTSVKSPRPVSFASASWQEVQGNLQQDGANYTTHMFATIHGNRMYVLTQMAPQSVYADEENVVFAPMRNSFAFL